MELKMTEQELCEKCFTYFMRGFASGAGGLESALEALRRQTVQMRNDKNMLLTQFEKEFVDTEKEFLDNKTQLIQVAKCSL